MPHRRIPASPLHRLALPALDREIVCAEDESIFHAARRHGVRVVGACGGRGVCGSCMVRLAHGEALIDNDKIVHGGRKWSRACRMKPRRDCEIEIAARSLAPVVRADVDADWSLGVAPASPIAAYDVNLAEASLADPRGDFERIAAALPVPVAAIDLHAARTLPDFLRQNDWSARLFVQRGTIVGVAPSGRTPLGLAIDLGTTNIVGMLIDLSTGERLASLGIENPQVAWGADIVTRLNHATTGATAADELRDAAVTGLNALARDLVQAVGLATTDILDVAVCGNTAMQHLLLGLPVRQLGRAPFVAAVASAVNVSARDLGLSVAPGASIHAAPGVGGFVGSDHVATLLATRSRWSDGLTALIMDIGTNTEISLIHAGQILSASCPSGPALEGGHISCGMRAAEGAIERVRAEHGRLVSSTIGGTAPVGLCGSGILDALAATLRLGLVDRTGRIRPEGPDVQRHAGHLGITLAPEVNLVQQDIRAIQLAKAAIRTGVDLLLDRVGIAESAIDHFVLAGAFGRYIDIGSAVDVGLLPALPRERFAQVGNAAMVGATRMLASISERDTARDIAGRCTYVELSSHPQFQKRFMKNIGFDVIREEQVP